MRSRIVLLLALAIPKGCVSAKETINHVQFRTIESYMNASANPCTDFYQYACGNWEKAHPNATYTDTFEYVDYKIDEEYVHIIKSRRKTASRQKHFIRQILSYYKSCMSLDEFLPTLYIDCMNDYENVTWPDIEVNNKNNTYDWLYMLATLRKYGLNGVLLTETVLQKRNDSLHFVVDVDRPVIDDEFEPLKRSQFEQILEYLGTETKRKQRQLWITFRRFESKILELYNIDDDIGYEEVKLSSIANIPQLVRYLKIVLELEHLDRKMLLTISNRPYMHALFHLLENYEEEFIARYLMIRFLWHLNYNGPTGFDKMACVSNVRQQMPLAMAWLYEQNNRNLVGESENIERIFESLRMHFSKILNDNANNFDDQVLEFLNKKLKRMQVKVGNLPRNATLVTIEEFYRDLNLSGSDFYANHLKLLRFNMRKQHEQLSTTLPLDAQQFYYLEDTNVAATSTPYFLQRNNIVIVPLTLLNLPLYHPQLHDIFKYSLVGFLLSHEMTHGFDDSGLDYDQYGNMQETSEHIKENQVFDNNFDCLFELNPRVIDEKIADVSGLRWAFDAYFFSNTTYDVHFPWSTIPQTQLFFRNFALFFCGALSNDKTLANSSHGTWRSRLHDTVSQFPEFGKAYDCPAGSPMNPVRKCQLWR